jgi:ankyrin repeat protein
VSGDKTFLAAQLANAVLNDDVKRVEALLHEGADIFATNARGETLLAAAVAAGERAAKSKPKSASARMFAQAQIKIAELFRAKAREPSAQQLSLVDAAALRDLDALRSHLTRSPPNADNLGAYAAVTAEAVKRDDAEVVDLLLAGGVDVDARCGPDAGVWKGFSMVGLAAACACQEAVRRLVAHGADVNGRLPPGMARPDGSTPLMMAALNSNLTIVKLLVEAGAELGAADVAGHTAMNHARRGGHKRVLAYLEACFEKRDVAADMDVCRAAAAGIAYRVRTLLEQGVHPDQRDEAGKTALMLAVGGGHAKIVHLLCEAGADVHATFGGSPAGDLWAFAFAHPKLDVMECLIEHGLDPNAPRGDLAPPLVLALRFDNKDFLRLLLAHGADPNGPIPAEPVRWVTAARERAARSQAFLAQRSGGAPAAPPPVGQICSVRDFAFYFSSREHYELLCPAEAATAEPTELPLYERLRTMLKSCPALADAAFAAEAERLGVILRAKPQPWRRRKAVIHYVAPMLCALAGHYGEKVPEGSDTRALATALLRRLQADVSECGYTLVYTGFSLAHKGPVRLLLLPLDEPLAVLAACGTNAANYGLGTRDVVAWCEETRRSHPLTVVGAGFDFVELGFRRPIVDSMALARRLAEFCRDLQVGVDDDRALGALAQRLERTGTCFLWWD